MTSFARCAIITREQILIHDLCTQPALSQFSPQEGEMSGGREQSTVTCAALGTECGYRKLTHFVFLFFFFFHL